MTRRLVYGCGLLLTIACTAMTIASIIMPRWVSNDELNLSMGLHSRCSGDPGSCHPLPRKCDDEDKYFCNMWKTVGFLISFDVIVELCTLVAFVVIISGGVQRRTAGWSIVCVLLLFSGFVQCAGMAVVSSLFNNGYVQGYLIKNGYVPIYPPNDDHSENGWYLDASWSLCTASWSILVLAGLGIAASAFYLPQEGDYELIPDGCGEVVQDEQ